MKKLIVFLLVFSTSLTGISNDKIFKTQKIVSGQWVKSWLLYGPIPLQLQKDPGKSLDHLAGFNTDYLKKSGGEANPVFLNKGRNTLLLKVEQHGNNWGFCVRFHPFSAVKAVERGDLFNVSTSDDGTSGIVSAFSKAVLSGLVQKLEAEVTDHQILLPIGTFGITWLILQIHHAFPEFQCSAA